MKTKITLLLLAFFMFVSNSYSQNTFDGDYCPGPGVSGDEYLGQLTTGALNNSGGTCEISQIWAKVDNLNASLRLSFKIGNAGTALIRLYIDTDNNSTSGLITDTSFGGSPAAGGAEYILQINTNSGATQLFQNLTSTTVTEIPLLPGGLSGLNGDSNGCNGGDKVFVEFYIPFASIGYNPCNTTQPGTINVARYASVSGGSSSSSLCTSQSLNFGVPLSGSVTPNQSICQGTNSSPLTLTINGGINTTVESWQSSTDGVTYVDIPGTGELYTYTPGILSEGDHYYRARILNTGICINAFYSSAAKITVNAAPSAPTTTLVQPTCTVATGTVNVTSPLPGTGITYTITGTNPVVPGVTNTTGIFAGLTSGIYSVTSKSASGCVSSPLSVTINPQPITPAAPTDPVDVTVCEIGSKQTLTATTTVPPGSTIVWYDANSGGNIVSPPTLVSTIAATKTLYGETSNGTCSSLARTAVTLIITGAPSAPASSGNITQCELSPIQTLNANSALASTIGITWYDAAAGGNIIASPIQNTVGTTTYFAQFNNGTCSSLARTAVTLTITGAPSAPGSSGDITQCELSPIQMLNANSALSSTIGVTWYDAAAGGNIIASPIQNTVGTTTYFAQFNNGTCSSLARTAVTLTITGAPSSPGSSEDITQCELSPIQTLNANSALSSTTGITWYDAATGGNIVASPTRNTVGTTTYFAQFNNGTCSSLTRTAVTLTITGAPSAPTSSGNITQCELSPIQTLNANSALSSTTGVTWYDAATGGNIVASPTRNSVGTATYFAQYTNGTCSSLTRTAVNLTITGASNAPTTGGNKAECQTNPTQTLTATATVPTGFSIIWYDAAINGNVVASPTWNSVGVKTYYAEAINNTTSCKSNTRTAVSLEIYPAIIANTIGESLSCAGDSDGNITLTVQGGTAPFNYSWKKTGDNVTIVSTAQNPGGLSAGTYNVLITDSKQCTTTASATIIDGDGTAPVISQLPGNTTIECPNIPAFTTATASDSVDPNPTLSYNDVTTPGSCPSEYSITRTWTAKDACGNTSIKTQTITVQDTTAPTFAGPANYTIIKDASCNYNSAPNPGNSPTNVKDNCDSSPIIPTFTDASCFDYSINTQMNQGQGYYYPVEISGYNNLTAGQLQKVAMEFTTNQGKGNVEFILIAPSGDGIVLTGSYCNGGFCDVAASTTYNPTFYPSTSPYSKWINTNNIASGSGNFEPNGGTSINAIDSRFNGNYKTRFEDLTGPMNGTWTLYGRKDTTASGTLQFSGVCISPTACEGNTLIVRTWTATDACGNTSDPFKQTINILDNTAPTWTTTTGTLDKTVECSDDAILATAQTLFPIATDNCDLDVTNIVKVPGAFIAGSCANSGTYTNTWTVTDNCGNVSTTFIQVISVQDKTAPVLSAVPADVTIECSAVPTASAADLTATDNCDAAPVVTYNEVKTEGNCTGNYTLTRTWTATDVCGNASSKSQVITVQDKTAPVLSAVPADVTIECSAVPNASAADLTATDNCDAAPVVTYKEVKTEENCAGNYTLTRTWTATDVCGNAASKSQIISVQDKTAPVLSAVPADVTVECSAVPNASAADLTATDNCDAAPVVTYKEVKTEENCAGNYILTRTWTATDVCGNAASKSQVITVQDKTAPILSAVPADVTVECSAVPTASAADLTATDNCDAAPVVTYNEVKTEGNCTGNYILTRTWTATDVCGNAASKSQVITVQDKTAPVLSAVPADVTIECSAVPTASAADLTATDNCDAAPVVTYNEVKTEGNCTGNYILTRTWTATDVCGNAASKSQVITVQDKTAPVLSAVPADVTIECSAVPTASAVDLTATDNCDAAPVVTYNEVKTEGNCTGNYTLTRTWTTTDVCGNAASKSQVITVQDTTKPVIINQATSIIVECDGSGNQTAIANWLASNGGAVASDNCSEVKWTNNFNALSNDCSTAVTVLFTATDICGNSSSTPATFSVNDTTKPAFVEEVLPANITVECSAVPIAATLTATDDCSSASVRFFENSDVGTCPGAYVLTRTWTAIDACNNSITHVQTVTVQDNTKPTFVEEVLPADVIAECDNIPAAVTLTATDNCGTAIVTYTEVKSNVSETCASNYTLTRTWTATDACGLTTNHTQIIKVQDTKAPTFVEEVLPADVIAECNNIPAAVTLTATDNCGTAIVTYAEVKSNVSETCANNYTLTRTWTATDACGLTTVHTQVIKVQDITPPAFVEEVLPADIIAECNNIPAAVTLTATDNCETAIVTYTEVKSNVSETCASNYTLTRTWTATDACGLTTTHTQIIKVQDTKAPTFVEEVLPADVIAECDNIPAAVTLTATDNCGTAIVTYTEVKSNVSETCASNYTLTRTWTATDACGLSTSHTQIIKVQDTKAPTFVEEVLPADVIAECDNITAAVTLTATDNCGTAIVTYTEVKSNVSETCVSNYTLTRTWTATDACGLTTSHTQIIKVQDTKPPTFVEEVLPVDVIAECDNVPAAVTLTATDYCGTATVTYTEVKSNVSETCASNYTLTRTWTATDLCGLIATHLQTVTIQDTSKPVIASLPASSTISCPATPAFAVATATDACGSEITLAWADVTTLGVCAGSYSVTRTWTAKDACGNTSTASQSINVQDTTGPTTTTAFEPRIDVLCDAIPAKPELVFVDNCSTVNTPVYAEKIINQTPISYSIEREWNVADACGNTSKFVQLVNVSIANTGLVIESSACNADSTPIDLNTLLPAGTPTNGVWINQDNVGILEGSIFYPLDATLGNHIFEYKVTDGSCPLEIKINMNVNFDCKVLGCEAIVVHKAFTPNGDGINDQLIIDGVEDNICYPTGISIEIYNRWGILVFETDNYNNTTNNFDGYSRGRTTISKSEGLPTGTYFYIVNYASYDGNGNIQMNKKDGFLYLSR